MLDTISDEIFRDFTIYERQFNFSGVYFIISVDNCHTKQHYVDQNVPCAATLSVLGQ